MLPRLYTDLAPWWALLSPVEAYADDAALVHALVTQALGRAPGSLLELGCGSGTLASWLPEEVALTLSDLSPDMLALAAARNPGATTVCGDLRTLRLGTCVDVVLIHDALMYLRTEHDIAAALQTARAHLAPGGVVLLMPDFTLESYHPGTDAGGGEDESGRAVRLLEWRWGLQAEAGVGSCRVEMSLLLRDAAGMVRAVHEQHTMGLFSQELWWRQLRAAGFQPEAADLMALGGLDNGVGEVFLAVAR